MEEPGQNPQEENRQDRPKLLTVICILTFIGSGMNFISCLIFFVFYDALKEALGKAMIAFSKLFNIPESEMLVNISPSFIGASVIIAAGAIAGAILMWQLRKVGFHVYTVSQILLVIAPMYFFRLPAPGVMDTLFAGTFVLLYSLNLKVLT